MLPCTPLTTGIEYTMSTVVGDFYTPGINGKSFINSTWEEGLSDVLEQVHFPESVTCKRGNKQFTYGYADLIRTAKAGLSLEDVPDEKLAFSLVLRR